MCHSPVRKLYTTVSKSTTIPGRKIGLLMFVCHSRSVCNSISDYVYMDISNLIIYLILNKTILCLRCLHELLLEQSFHVPVLHVIRHRSINGMRHNGMAW